MLFSSITFLAFFLPMVLLCYYTVPNLVFKNFVLLLFSLLFYAWGEPKFLLLMIVSICFNFEMGKLISKNCSKLILVISVAVNLLCLFIFKYLGFTSKIINFLLSRLNFNPLSELDLILPLGISFYTFQEISYLVDVYRNPNLVQKNILNLGLYISFFPQLIAGPIVRYNDINFQICNRNCTVSSFAKGLERFIVGLSKKVIFANSFALVCDSIYNAGFENIGILAAWIAAFSYSLQIYYDFSGYSDMAIGLAKMFGFDLIENFAYPYSASSITDFWKRWHISLTNFFRDYVYIPLGGNKKGNFRTLVNRIIVFLLTGLWHGAAYCFILWGLLHGLIMVIERKFKLNNIKNKFWALLYRVFVLLLITFLWILFRTGTQNAIDLWLKMLGIDFLLHRGAAMSISTLPLAFYYVDTKFIILSVLGGGIILFPWWRKFSAKLNNSCIMIVKYIVLFLLLVIDISFLANNTYNPFIYFRF